MMARLIIYFIKVYQYLLSPYLGQQCRFYPTCSQYAVDAIRKYGAINGVIHAVRRLLRCHPWHAGGHDPVP